MLRFRRTHRRRLRAAGFVFIIVAGTVLLAAWNSGTNLFYLVFAAVASFLIVSLLTAFVALRKIRVSRDAPYAAHRDPSFGVAVRIENRRALLPLLSVRVENSEEPGVPLGYVMSIPTRRGAVFRTKHRFAKRGVHKLPDPRRELRQLNPKLWEILFAD